MKPIKFPPIRTALVLTSLIAAMFSAEASSSDDAQRNYVKSQIPTVTGLCRNIIRVSAKDPDSLRFLTDFAVVEYGKSSMSIAYSVMGRNTYGAVLKHRMICNFSCSEKKGGCKLHDLEDLPN